VIAATEHLRAFQRDDAGPSEIADHFEDALGTVRRSWMIHMLLGEPPLELYVKAFARVAGIEPAQAVEPANGLIFGQDTVLTRLIDRLYELAVEARPFPAIRALVSDPPPAVLERLSALPEAASFLERLGSLLNDYGERTGNGMFSTATVLTPTWRERPDLLLRHVSGYLDPVVQPPDVARQLARHARDIYLDELCAASPDADAVPELRRQLALALRDATVLEEHNHYIDQMSLGQFRAAALRAGDALTDRGTISQRDDAFWLRSVEIVEALRSDIAPSHTGLVQERRASHDRWSALTPPAILGLPSSLLDGRPPLTDEVTPGFAPIAGRLQGKPGSGGRRTGRARVVATDTEVPRVASGDILVAENASPQWTPLFPVLGGLVLDGGVMGEHALATAREYGIPAVISTGTATAHIAEGQAITVDGSAGVVYLDATG
jgi:rifampicin phosphotransferase